MENKSILKSIKIHPSKLTSNLKNHIMDVLKETYENKCILNIGYIIEVLKIENIQSSFISRANSEIILNVKFNINYIEPKVDSILQVKVCHVIEEHGILCRINNIRIIVAKNTLSDFNFNRKSKSFTKENTSIKLDDQIKVQIKGVKFSNDIYNCFASLVL